MVENMTQIRWNSYQIHTQWRQNLIQISASTKGELNSHIVLVSLADTLKSHIVLVSLADTLDTLLPGPVLETNMYSALNFDF